MGTGETARAVGLLLPKCKVVVVILVGRTRHQSYRKQHFPQYGYPEHPHPLPSEGSFAFLPVTHILTHFHSRILSMHPIGKQTP